jgi:3-oxoacyl-[acyl-carrier-protein] synthase-3
MSSVGILGLGTYLPSEIRTNDYWSPSTVARWQDGMAARVTRADAPSAGTLTPGQRRTLAAMAEYAGDPFRGAVERRVMAETMTAHEMEAAAAREAIERAGLRPDQIDAILVQSRVPEHLLVNGACVTHRLLGLPQRCQAISTNLACNAFAMHVTLAQALVASGQARYVLTIQSSAMTRVMRPEDPVSAWMGDAAAAAVIGPVGTGQGVLASIHNANGAASESLVFGVPGKRWWDDGRIELYAPNHQHTRAMLMTLVDRAGETISQALAAAGVTAADVDFYAAHQGMPWLTRETAAHCGLGHAKTIATFAAFGNLSSVNLPLILALGEREHLIREGSIVVTFSGGIGETWSSLVLRWGNERSFV